MQTSRIITRNTLLTFSDTTLTNEQKLEALRKLKKYVLSPDWILDGRTGLCGAVNFIGVALKVLSHKESNYLHSLIEEYPPKRIVAKALPNRPYSMFLYWKSGARSPRVKWINKRISEIIAFMQIRGKKPINKQTKTILNNK